MEDKEFIALLVEKARIAQRKVNEYTQEQIDDVIRSIAWEVYCDENIEKLATLAVDETGMGVKADKIAKHKNKVLGALRDGLEGKSVGIIERDEKKGIIKYAKPIGVIGALTPVTNPTATPASNSIAIVKGRNAVILAPHPRAAKATALAVAMMRDGLRRVGAPEDLIQVIDEPTLDRTGELMRQVDLVVATGGGPMVRAAYSSGKPAYGVGPGNTCQIIAEDADIEAAADMITKSKIFDNATSCSSENSLVIQKTVYDAMIAQLQSRGGYLLNAEEKAKLLDYMWVANKKGIVGINGKIVAKSAKDIAAGAGLDVPENTTMLLIKGDMPLESDRFAQEKLSPVLTLFCYDEFMEGYEILRRLTDNCGTGHSCGIQTYNETYIDYLGTHMKSSRIMVRQGQASANGGCFTNGMPSTTTLGCGTWGNNITTENINYRHFINITWLSYPTANNRPSDESMWGDFFQRYTK